MPGAPVQVREGLVRLVTPNPYVVPGGPQVPFRPKVEGKEGGTPLRGTEPETSCQTISHCQVGTLPHPIPHPSPPWGVSPPTSRPGRRQPHSRRHHTVPASGRSVCLTSRDRHATGALTTVESEVSERKEGTLYPSGRTNSTPTRGLLGEMTVPRRTIGGSTSGTRGRPHSGSEGVRGRDVP